MRTVALGTCLVIVAVSSLVAATISSSSSVATDGACATSDANLLHLQGVACMSMAGGWCPRNGVTPSEVHYDWPMQASYSTNVLNALIAPSTCLNTSVGLSVARWFTNQWADINLGGSLVSTMLLAQAPYYDMPRHPGDRIESPWTLGMKCLANALLAETWHADRSTFVQVMDGNGLNASAFADPFDSASSHMMTLCSEVLANCFVNASYDPKRNGTCPLSVDEFHLGFDWQNVRVGHDAVAWPWW